MIKSLITCPSASVDVSSVPLNLSNSKLFPAHWADEVGIKRSLDVSVDLSSASTDFLNHLSSLLVNLIVKFSL